MSYIHVYDISHLRVNQYIQENGSLLAVKHHTKHEVQWNVEGKENITGIIQ
jgi:hypothetical protein